MFNFKGPDTFFSNVAAPFCTSTSILLLYCHFSFVPIFLFSILASIWYCQVLVLSSNSNWRAVVFIAVLFCISLVILSMFIVLICHQYIFFKIVSVQFSSSFLFVFLFLKFESSLYILMYSLIKYVYYQFFTICGLLFYFLISIFHEQKFLILKSFFQIILFVSDLRNFCLI